jgi:enoyl-CoA hydratase
VSTDVDAGAVLLVEQLGAVRRLTLNRPSRHNALTDQLFGALLDEMRSAALDPLTSAIVIRGAGPSFSSGWDLSEKLAHTADAVGDRLALADAANRMNAVWECPLPLIAQVHGYCLAGAADLVLHCDLVVIARDARFGHPAVRSLGVPTSHMWLYRFGPLLAKHLLLTGDTIDGERAVEVGLALSAHDVAELDDVALALAERITRSNRDALVANKRVVNHGIELMGRTALQRFAQAEDVLAHQSPGAEAFRRTAGEKGLREAFRERDAAFGRGDSAGEQTP